MTKGAQVVIGDGAIAHQCTGSFVIKSAKTEFSGAGDGSSLSIRMPESITQHNQRVRLVDLATGEPLVDHRYRITMEDGQVIDGITGVDGMTQDFRSEIPFGSYSIEAILD